MLPAVDDRGVAVPRVGRLHAGHVGAGGGLGDAQGQRRAARDVGLHVLLDLLRRAELAHVVHRGHAHGVERGQRSAVAGDGEVGKRHRHEVDVGAAHFFRQAQAREAGLCHGLPGVPGELAVTVALALLLGRHLALQKLLDAFDEQLLLFGLREIDHCCMPPWRSWCAGFGSRNPRVENSTSSDRRRSWRSAFLSGGSSGYSAFFLAAAAWAISFSMLYWSLSHWSSSVTRPCSRSSSIFASSKPYSLRTSRVYSPG